MTIKTGFINTPHIHMLLQNNVEEDHARIDEILQKARLAKGLNIEEVAILANVKNQRLINKLFETAKAVKEAIYGKRLVLFAPFYLSNVCPNECLYCAFRNSNQQIKRHTLTHQEIIQETEILLEQGHKRLLLVSGEATSLSDILKALEALYATKTQHGEIRRINVNVAPLSIDEFKQLKQARIGTYQLFQETYDPDAYQSMHIAGPKSDYLWRLNGIDRAMEAGIDDVGIGALFGLADWRFELLALMQHTAHLNEVFGIGPHTISVPRIEPALGAAVSKNPPHPVSDEDFCKLIAILRLAVPSTGIILSTRENAELRSKALALGVSQISAGSRTNPGGYAQEEVMESQFSLGDHRSLDEVVADVAQMGYIPSFCTACYRLSRTGKSFMDLAKTGRIKNFCDINAILSFKEYLMHYASIRTREAGNDLIQKTLPHFSKAHNLSELLNKIENGQLDVFV